MSFLVREISRTADGREIVRPSTIDKDVLTIGRGADNDIQLEDLAATLHHAVLRRAPSGSVHVESVNELPIDVDGRSVRTATVPIVTGGNLRIGAHSIAIGRGEQGEILVTVERVGAISDSADYVDENKAFSLVSVAPSRRIMAYALAAAVLLLGLAWPIWSFYAQDAGTAVTAADARAERPKRFHGDELWSTGSLSLAHANLQNDCKACHQQPGVAVRDTACVACHTDVHDHGDPRRLVNARQAPDFGARFRLAVAGVFNVPPGRCVECHTEHDGAKQMPITAQRFCTDCHASLDQRLRDTKMENAGDFGTAHSQFRVSVLTSWDGPKPQFQRMSLDARPQEDSGLKFPHALHLSTTNGVARMAQTMADDHGFGQALECKNCHVADRTGVRFQQVSMEQSCSMCHSLAFDRSDGVVRTLRHGQPRQVVAELRDFYAVNGPAPPASLGGMARRRPGDFAAERTAFNYASAANDRGGRAARAIRAVFSPGGACYDCHVIETHGAAGVNFDVHPVRLTDRYMAKGWFDHEPHKQEPCASCHAAKTSNSSRDVILPKIDSCRTCHGGESARKEVPSACAMCHDYHIGAGPPSMAKRVRRERIAALN